MCFTGPGSRDINDAAIGYFRQHKPILQAYREMETSGNLHIRVYLTIVEEVYSFHMPLFMFLSGFVAAYSSFQNGNVFRQIAKKFKSVSYPILGVVFHCRLRSLWSVQQHQSDRLYPRFHKISRSWILVLVGLVPMFCCPRSL